MENARNSLGTVNPEDYVSVIVSPKHLKELERRSILRRERRIKKIKRAERRALALDKIFSLVFGFYSAGENIEIQKLERDSLSKILDRITIRFVCITSLFFTGTMLFIYLSDVLV